MTNQAKDRTCDEATLKRNLAPSGVHLARLTKEALAFAKASGVG